MVLGGKAAVRKVKRAQILLAADAGSTDEEIARNIAVGTSPVYRVKQSFVDAEFVARMEDVLSLYAEPPDDRTPMVCFDETPRQLIGEERVPIQAEPGKRARYDYEYVRNGTANIFMFVDVNRPWRHAKVTEHRTGADFADCMRDLGRAAMRWMFQTTRRQPAVDRHCVASRGRFWTPGEHRADRRRCARQVRYSPPMRLIASGGILGLVVLSSPAGADDSCSATVTAERRSADSKVKAGDAKAALARLEAVKQRCFDKLPPQAQLWLLSDMALAAHRAGDNDRCAELILDADPGAAARYPKVAKALLYNAGLCKPKDGCDYKLDDEEPVCKMRLALEYSERNSLTGFAATPCELAGHKDAVSIRSGSCIEATEFRKTGDDEITCPTFRIIDGKGNKRKLTFGNDGGGWVESPSDCCAVRDIKVKTERGKVTVLVGSREPSRDCFGGTATTDHLTLYDLVGAQLVLRRDLSISFH